jgi:hypothetical protein
MPAMTAIQLDLRSVAAKPAAMGPLLALDFGTAFSKAAVAFDRSGGPITALRLGDVARPLDQAMPGNPYVLASCIYLEEDRFLFGAQAYARSQSATGKQRRLDSLKLLFNRDDLGTLATHTVPLLANSSPAARREFSFKEYDLALLYLAFLTAMAGQAAVAEGLPQYLPRRFAVPGWSPDRLHRYAGMIARMLAAAQILADSLAAHWHAGVDIADARAALDAVAATPVLPMQLIDQGLHEATAAGACVFNKRWRKPHILCVVDIGAGTVDSAAFLVFKHLLQPFQPFRITQIKNTACGYEQAGDALDDALMALAFRQAGFDADDPMRARRRDAVRRRIREQKEALFKPPFAVDIDIAPGITETVIQANFLADPAVTAIAQGWRETFRASIAAIGPALFDNHGRTVDVYLTGGGANLPFALAMTDEKILVGGKKLKLERIVGPPDWMRALNAPWIDHFSQLAVALGATRPDIPEGAGSFLPAALNLK